MKYKITVVVSVYNVEEYLDRCIQSLLQQTFRDFELILVDDGSPDRCPGMCDEWAKKDPRISAFHKANGGLSSARNLGIEHAKGEYIIFPDPDDWVEPDYLEKLLALKNEYNADLSICSDHLECQENGFKEETVLLNRDEALRELMKPKGFCGYAWNKLYSMDVILKNDLRFDEELGAVQDLHFNVRYFLLCDSFVYATLPLYHYVINSGSVSSRSSALTPRKISGLLAYKKIAELVHDRYPDIEEDSYSSLCNLCLKHIDVYYKSHMKSKELLDMLTGDFRKHYKSFRRCRIYDEHYKRCSWMVLIHPRIYYYARRIYWRVFLKNR